MGDERALKHPRVRSDLIAGPHPDDPNTWLLYDAVTGRQYEIPAEGWQLLTHFDGRRSPRTVARRADVAMEVVEGFVDRLFAMGLLTQDAAPPVDQIPPAQPQWTREVCDGALELVVHPEARFECSQAGTCCRSGYVIPLNRSEARAVRRAALVVLGPDVDPVGLLPTTPGAPWTYALDNEESCPFLADDARCGIHGQRAYPPACQIFPYVFGRIGSAVHASIAHRCVCGAGGTGRLLSSDRAGIGKRLGLLDRVATVPAKTLVDRRAVDSEAVVAALAEASALDQVWEMLLGAAERLAVLVGAPPSRVRSVDNDEVYATLGRTAHAWRDPILDAALGRRPHPQRRRIRADLRRASLWNPRGDAAEECRRFVRDHLHGLRVYHYETITAGLLVLALAAHHILDRLPRIAHPVARERVMLWEEALTTDALSRLVSATPQIRRITADVRRTAVQIGALAAASSRGG